MIADAPKNIQEILKRLPQKPGVYQYFDEKGDIIYVGKAKKLKDLNSRSCCTVMPLKQKPNQHQSSKSR